MGPWKYGVGTLLSLILLFSILNSSFSAVPDTNPPVDSKSKIHFKEKIDKPFRDKVDKMIEKGEDRYHRVIIFVKNIVDPKERKLDATKNKDALEAVLLKTHQANKIYKAKVLSFVSADVPIGQIDKIAMYDYVDQIGDGELESESLSAFGSNDHSLPLNYPVKVIPVETNMDVAKQAVSLPSSGPTGNGIIVALLDRGIRQNSTSSHPDLPFNQTIIKQVRCDPLPCYTVPMPSALANDTGTTGNHGTHNAGIIAGQGTQDSNLKGVAPNAKLINIKMGSNYLEALDFALNDGARVASINLAAGDCLNSGYNSIVRGTDEAVERGLVIAAGIANTGNNFVNNLACGYNVMAVGAFDDNNTPQTYDDVVWSGNGEGSSKGPALDSRLKPEIVAPGVRINSTDMCDTYNWQNRWNGTHCISWEANGKKNITGTSHAGPFVGSTSALILEQHPNFSPEQVKAAILLGARWNATVPMNATYYEDNSRSALMNSTLNTFGFGFLDINQTLTLANTGENIIKDEITEGKTKKFEFSANNGEQVKVILSWLIHPSGNITNPGTPTASDLDFVIKRSNGSTATSSSSRNQTNEFTIFNANATDTYTIEVSAPTVVAPLGIETFALASTHAIRAAADTMHWQVSPVHHPSSSSDKFGTNASICASNSNTIYISENNSVSGGDLFFSKSTDDGKIWSTTSIHDNSSNWNVMDCVGSSIFIIHRPNEGGNNLLKLAKSIDGGATWTQHTIITSNYAEEASISAVDADTIWVVYRDILNDKINATKSGDGGQTWSTPVVVDTGITTSISASGKNIDAFSSSTAYVAYKKGIQLTFAKTTNGGSSWTTTSIGSGQYGYFANVKALDASNIYLAYKSSSNPRFVKTNDGGSTWSTPTDISSQNFGYVSMHIVDQNTIFVTYRDGGYAVYANKSTNGGNSWPSQVLIHTIDTNGGYAPNISEGGNSVVAVDNGNKVYVALQSIEHSQYHMLLAWTDTSITETRIDTLEGRWTNVAPYNSTHIYISYKQVQGDGKIHVRKTTNGGFTPNDWTDNNAIGLGEGQNSIGVALDDPNTVYVIYAFYNSTSSTYQYVYKKSTDGGVIWSGKSIDNMNSDITSADDADISIAVIDANTVYACYWNTVNNKIRVVKTSDGGSTWTNFDNSSGFETQTSTGRSCFIYALDSNNIFVSYSYYVNPNNNELRILKTDNGGNNWVKMVPTSNCKCGYASAIVASDQNKWFVAYLNQTTTPYKVYFRKATNSTDGVIWTPPKLLDEIVNDYGVGGGFGELAMDRSGSTIAVAYYANHADILLQYTTDDGVTWTKRVIATTDAKGQYAEDHFFRFGGNKMFFAYREEVNYDVYFART